MKPIYNHITGKLDPDETVSPTPIVIFEGLHPMYDDRVNAALDMTVYLDITDDVKFAWKVPTAPLPHPTPGRFRGTTGGCCAPQLGPSAGTNHHPIRHTMTLSQPFESP